MSSILVLQNTIMSYRKPVYNALAERYKVRVLHAGPPSVGSDDRYEEIIVPARKLGPFMWQDTKNIRREIACADVVIAMFDLRWPTYLAPLFRHNRPRYILWGHRYSGRKIADKLRDGFMKRADRLLMYGDEEFERMIGNGVDPQKIIIAWNTIHVSNHADYSEQQKKSLLFVGRLQRRKRIDMLLSIFSKAVADVCDELELDIVGDGEERKKLEDMASELRINDRVHFHGSVTDDQVLVSLFSRALAYISPGPIGLSALHAFAYGVPVITSTNVRHGPEFHNLRDGENSLLFETQEDLGHAIQKLCNDRAYAAELGRNAYRYYIENRTLDRMLSGIIKAIEG